MNILPTTKSMKPLVLVHFTKCLIFLAGALPMKVPKHRKSLIYLSS